MKKSKKSQTTEELTLWIIRILIVVIGLFAFYNYIYAMVRYPVYIYEVKGKYLLDRLFFNEKGISCTDVNGNIIFYCVDYDKLASFENRFDFLYSREFNSVFISLVTELNQETFVFNKDHFVMFFPLARTRKIDYFYSYDSKYVKLKKSDDEYLAKISIIVLFPKE
ncbi:MAG: hypothetical protein QXR30_02795 [Candidatus Woesearchaeota archaeon]